jgi:hypothetical protein
MCTTHYYHYYYYYEVSRKLRYPHPWPLVRVLLQIMTRPPPPGGRTFPYQPLFSVGEPELPCRQRAGAPPPPPGGRRTLQTLQNVRHSRMPFQIFYGPRMPSPIPVRSPHCRTLAITRQALSFASLGFAMDALAFQNRLPGLNPRHTLTQRNGWPFCPFSCHIEPPAWCSQL